MPYPFEFPANVAGSAKAAKANDKVEAYAEQQCKTIADPSSQGSRMFIDGVPLWPMMENVGRAAYVYSQDVIDVWGDVFAKCNSMSGMAAEGVGYGIAYVYAEGLIESLGITAILESAYKKGQAQTGDGCKAVAMILDVAAAVIKARDTAADELFHVMPSYSKALGRCTPKDSEQQFKPHSLRASLAVDKKNVEVTGGRH